MLLISFKFNIAYSLADETEMFFSQIFKGKKFDSKVLEICQEMRIQPEILLPRYLDNCLLISIYRAKNDFYEENVNERII